jgi:protein CpxP
MNQKTNPCTFASAAVVMVVAFLSIFFVASVNPAFAASSKKKSPAIARTSAVDHTEARIKQLFDALKITEAQQELWKSFTQVMRENAIELDALSKDKSEIIKTMNAVDYLKFHNQITETHLNQQKRLIPAFEALYTSMSDEQKKSTDLIFRTGKHGKKKIN